MEMTTDMLAPEDVLAPAKPAAPATPALLAINPQEYVTQVFAPFRAKLTALKAEADAIHFDGPTALDITTTAGMAVAVKMRAAFRDDVRLSVEKTKVARKAPILQIGRLLDSTYNEIVAEVTPYEGKFDAAIKAEEKRKADIKAAKERAEAERIGTIKAAIEAIRALPDRAAGKSAEELRALLERVAARVITKEEFAEFDGEAQIALDASGQQLVAMYGAAQQAEQAAAAAEAARLAEIERIAAERAELAKLRAEADERERVAKAEHALIVAAQEARAQQLLDAEIELHKQREITAAAAQAEADKVAAANAAAAKVIADAAADLVAKQAAFQREQDEVRAAAALAEQKRADSAALYQAMADHFDDAFKEYMDRAAAEHDAKCAEKQVMADQSLVDGRERQNDERVAGLPSGSLSVAALTDALVADEVTDEDIIKLIADEYGMSILGAVNRIAAIDVDAARTLAEAV